MLSDAEVKKNFKKETRENPEKHFPVQALKEAGFYRGECSKCHRFFWSQDKQQNNCGDPVCSGGFRFVGNSPVKQPLSYTEVWQRFAKVHKELGYTPVRRYPVIARWNPTTDFTIASIAAFQPLVVSGEVEPPANPLTIPQFCVRFTDIDNVGITGHFCGFVMMGEHAFVPPKEYNQNKYFRDHLTWLTKGMGIPVDELTVHEDAWAGGGNFGPCMEFFCRGLEVSNQVYMQYEVTEEGTQELRIKVLDMGQGQERAAWFTQGSPTSYDATFPAVLKKLYARTGVKQDKGLMSKFVQWSGHLNVDEVEDMDAAWRDVASKLSIEVAALKEKILPMQAVYSVAEHARALLVVIADGGLPSNVGGMYNLRVILRRALGFIDKYEWDIDLKDVCAWHAEELKEQFPELLLHVDNVGKIIGVERSRFEQTKEKTGQIVARAVERDISTEDLLELYDSQGISPELVRSEAEKLGKHVRVPDNFYALVAQRHEQKVQETQTKREHVDIGVHADTVALYFDDWAMGEFSARVLGVKDAMVVLDKTAFYPTSGGQVHDVGVLSGVRVIDVFKQGNVIVHVLDKVPKWIAGDTVKGCVDMVRRKQLAQHHTATHIINAAARKVLGPHVNQASAKKDVDKAHLDITHYAPLSENEVECIEQEANKLIRENIVVKKKFMPRALAEKEYGMGIYQGGAVPGKELRMVVLGDVDVEACGGTHLHATGEAECIKILKTSKVKDGVVRIVFAAGDAARAVENTSASVVNELSGIFGVSADKVPARAEELFAVWKRARKAAKKKQPLSSEECVLSSSQSYAGDVLARTAEILQTQPEHLVKTVKRFFEDIEKFRKDV